MSVLVRKLTQESAALVEHARRCLVVLRNGTQGFGAGIIWHPDGLVVTNNHVLGKKRVLVVTAGGKEYAVNTLARDRRIDLALLQVEARDLPAARVGDSRALRVGEIVMALGHPWGRYGAVTAGIISALGKAHFNGAGGEEQAALEVIRSDVRLAPGNSGGPLLNARGQVVGINTMVVGGDQGIALPSHIVQAFVQAHFGDLSG